MKPRSTSSQVEMRPRSPPALERLCDRILLMLGGIVLILLLCVLVYGLLRGSGRVGAAYTSLQVVVVGAILTVVVLLCFRRRLYTRVSASKLTALSMGILVPIALVELYANLFDLRGYLYYAQSEEYFQWQQWEGTPLAHEHLPNSTLQFPWGRIATNSRGWRGPEYSRERPRDTLRVLALGDSAVFSWGVDQVETITNRIQRCLADDADLSARYDRVEVINTGNCSYTSVDELIVLKRDGLDYDPQLVIMVSVDNDFTDRPAFRDQVEYLAREDMAGQELLQLLAKTSVERATLQQPRSGSVGAFLGFMTYSMKRSFLVTTAARLVRQWKRGDPSSAASGAARSSSSPAFADVFRRYAFIREQTAAIQEVAEACRDAGIPFVLFTYAMGNSPLEAYLRDQLGEIATVHDLVFEDGDDRDAMVNSRTDSHLNAEGTRVFGSRMAEVIKGVLVN